LDLLPKYQRKLLMKLTPECCGEVNPSYWWQKYVHGLGRFFHGLDTFRDNMSTVVWDRICPKACLTHATIFLLLASKSLANRNHQFLVLILLDGIACLKYCNFFDISSSRNVFHWKWFNIALPLFKFAVFMKKTAIKTKTLRLKLIFV